MENIKEILEIQNLVYMKEKKKKVIVKEIIKEKKEKYGIFLGIHDFL